jgi:hypothetical protein
LPAIVLRRRCKAHAKHPLRDLSVLGEVVEHGVDCVRVLDGVAGERGGTESKDTVDAGETLRGGRAAEGLAGNFERGGEREGVGVCADVKVCSVSDYLG